MSHKKQKAKINKTDKLKHNCGDAMRIKEVLSCFAPFLFGLVFFGLMFIVLFTFVSTHEQIHQIIYKDYGVDSYVLYNANPFTTDWSGITIPYNMTLASERCNDTCHFAHEMNEIVGYNTEIIIAVIFLILIVYAIFQGWRIKYYGG